MLENNFALEIGIWGSITFGNLTPLPLTSTSISIGMSRVSLSESDDGNSTNIHATDARTYYSFGSGKPPFLDRIRGKKDLYTSIDDVCKEAFDVTQEARRLSKSKHCPPGAPKNITKTIKKYDYRPIYLSAHLSLISLPFSKP